MRNGRRQQIVECFAEGKISLLNDGLIMPAFLFLIFGLRLANEKFNQCGNKKCKSCRDFTLPYKMKILLLLGFTNIVEGKPKLGFNRMRSSLKIARRWKAMFGT